MGDIIYKLKPVKQIEPNFYKLKWRAIKHRGYENEGTWNLYISKGYKGHRSLGFRISKNTFQNYGRGHDCFSVELFFWWFDVEFWIKWNFIAHKDGPNDLRERKPLDLSSVKTERAKP